MAKEKNDHISEIYTKPCPVLDAAPFKNLSTKAAEKPAKSELERKKKAYRSNCVVFYPYYVSMGQIAW